MEEYFETEQELFEHLIAGGTIRPHFQADRTNRENWIHLKDGNRVYVETGISACNCLISLGYWVKAEHMDVTGFTNFQEAAENVAKCENRDQVARLVNEIDRQYNEGTLDVKSSEWPVLTQAVSDWKRVNEPERFANENML